jgi:hypothetical protein
MNKQIVGITGLKRSGKDTSAEYLVNRYAFDRYSFAQPLKDMISVLMNCVDSNDKYFSELHKEENIPGINASYRKLTQTIGTEWGRHMIDDNIWVNMLAANTEYVDKIVISDVRFDNEAKWVKKNGGIIIKVTRPVLKSSKDNHPSEQGIDESYIDHNIINDGTIDSLHSKLDAIFGNTDTIYKSSLEQSLLEILDDVTLNDYNIALNLVKELSKKLKLSFKF